MMRRFGALFFACHFNGTFNLPSLENNFIVAKKPGSAGDRISYIKLSNGYAIQWGLHDGTGSWGLHTYALPFDMIAYTFANAFAARNAATEDYTGTQFMTGRGATRGWYTETNPGSNKIQGYESTQYIRIGKTADTPKTIVCIKY